ncbi:MAG: paraquat-inducible protein A [Maribacter sp.]|jgi:paraquat-inducible protein A
MSKRNIVATVLILVSLGCLYPGLTRNVLTIQVGATLPLIGEVNLYSATRSILGTITELRKDDNTFVAFLILFFSVIIPIFKTISLLIVLLAKNFEGRKPLYKFVVMISKWSMADVFVVGVFLSFLATRSNKDINAWLHDGFYFFLAYCLISILATQIMDIEEN